MTTDGSKVFFTSEDRLTGADTDNSVDLYQWSEATDSITLLSQGNGNGDTDECAALWDTAATSGRSSPSARTSTTRSPRRAATSTSTRRSSSTRRTPACRTSAISTCTATGAVHYVTTLDPGT